jgi:hypothetical protein
MLHIAAADLVRVPVTPGEGDLVEAQRTVTYLNGRSRSARRTITVRVVANRIRLRDHAFADCVDCCTLRLFAHSRSPAQCPMPGSVCRHWRSVPRQSAAEGG